MLKVTASPFNLHTEYVKEDSVKLVWDFDQHNKVDYYIVKRNGQQCHCKAKMSPLSAKEKCPLLLSKAFTELNLKGATLIFRQILNTLTPKRKCPLPLLGKFEY